jgi:sorbose reductase
VLTLPSFLNRPVNFNGVFYCAQIGGKYFKEAQRPGNIIVRFSLPLARSHIAPQLIVILLFLHSQVTASMSGHIVNFPQKQGCYNAAKAGCIHMVKVRRTFSISPFPCIKG